MAKKTDNKYSEARKAFDDLKVEDKARFMFEAMFSTVSEGLTRFSEAVSDAMDEVTRKREHEANGTSAGAGEATKKKSPKKPGGRKSTPAKGAETNESE